MRLKQFFDKHNLTFLYIALVGNIIIGAINIYKGQATPLCWLQGCATGLLICSIVYNYLFKDYKRIITDYEDYFKELKECLNLSETLRDQQSSVINALQAKQGTH